MSIDNKKLAENVLLSVIIEALKEKNLLSEKEADFIYDLSTLSKTLALINSKHFTLEENNYISNLTIAISEVDSNFFYNTTPPIKFVKIHNKYQKYLNKMNSLIKTSEKFH